MKKKILLVLVGTLFLTLSVGCDKTNKKENKTVQNKINGNCSAVDCIKKLNTFLHPGRNELMLADNIILVEGYTEEVLLKYYLSYNNYYLL